MLGFPELVIMFVIALLAFGPRTLPSIFSVLATPSAAASPACFRENLGEFGTEKENLSGVADPGEQDHDRSGGTIRGTNSCLPMYMPITMRIEN
jgi:Sec-independent protein translocase protein TatA